MSQDQLVTLEMPALPAYVGVARTVVSAVAMWVDGIDDDRLEDLRIAVSEACTNAVEANLADRSRRRVTVTCTVTDDDLEVCVEDSDGLVEVDLRAADSATSLDGDAQVQRGWGLQLIEALVDEVEISASPGGTAVWLRIRRSKVS